MLLLSASSIAAPSGAAARDPRELLTPRGWEEAAVRSRPQPREDMALPDDELIEPSGWRTSSPCGANLGFSGDVCSELLVPADWSALLRSRVAVPHE